MQPNVKSGLDFVVVKGVSEKSEFSVGPSVDKIEVPVEVEKIVVVKESYPRGTVLRQEMLELRPMGQGRIAMPSKKSKKFWDMSWNVL